MKFNLFFLFLGMLFTTTVLAASSPNQTTSKDQSLNDIENQSKKAPAPTEPKEFSDQLVQPTEVPEVRYTKNDFFFSDSRAVTLYTGIMDNINSVSSVLYGMYGFSYMWYSQRLFHFETGFDISVNQEAHLRIMGRWNSHSTDRCRPYFNAGLGLRVLPQDNLGVVLSWGRLILQLGYGFDYSFSQNVALKVEAFGGTDSAFNGFFGIVMGPSLSF